MLLCHLPETRAQNTGHQSQPQLTLYSQLPHGTGQHYASWHRATLCLMAQGNTMPHGKGQHYASWHRAKLCLKAQSNTIPHGTGQNYASKHKATLYLMAKGQNYASKHKSTLYLMIQGNAMPDGTGRYALWHKVNRLMSTIPGCHSLLLQRDRSRCLPPHLTCSVCGQTNQTSPSATHAHAI